MKVAFSRAADADLEEIGEYIATDNAHHAVTFVRDIRATALAIGDAPQAFPILPEFGGSDVRRRPFRDYLIIYTIDRDRVVILRVLHGARDIKAQGL